MNLTNRDNALRITTVEALRKAVEDNRSDHPWKEVAELLLDAMNDWPTPNLVNIADYMEEFKRLFGSPLTAEKIIAVSFNKENAWELEAGSAIIALIQSATENHKEIDLDFY